MLTCTVTEIVVSAPCQKSKSKVEAREDNRLDILHAARFLPGMACSAAKMWLMARDVIGPNGIPPYPRMI